MKTMRSRIFLLMLMVSLSATLPSLALVFMGSRDVLRTATLDRLEQAGNYMERSLGAWMDTQISDAFFIASLPDVTRDSQSLAKLADLRPALKGIFILTNPVGRVEAASNPEWMGKYFNHSEFFLQGRKGLFIQKVYPWPVDLEPSLTIALPLSGSRVLCCNPRLSRLDDIQLAATNLGPGGHVYLVDLVGNPVSSRSIGQADYPHGLSSQGISAVTLGQNGSGSYLDYRGAAVIGNYRWISSVGLGLMVEMDEAIAFAPAFTLGMMILFTGLGAIILAGLASWAISRSLNQPLSMLSSAAEAISGGQWEMTLPLDRKDEIGSLARSFSSMATAVRGYQDQMQAQVALRTDQLVEAEKLALLGRLVAGVAHEVNTPLGVAITANSYSRNNLKSILGSHQQGVLKQEFFENQLHKAIESLDLAETNLTRAAEFIRTFKQIAADQAIGDARQINLAVYLRELVNSLKPRIKKSAVQVILDIPEGIAMKCIPSQLYQIVTNLVMNSLAHAYPEGEKGRIELSARQEGSNLVLAYQDDGKGIEAKLADRVFEPFFTTARSSGGTGLGLYIVKNLASKMGGSITLDSSPGMGARFTLVLPLEIPAT